MKYHLIVASGKRRGLVITIEVDLFTFGSDRFCQLRSKLPGIGNQHCCLVTRDKKLFVRDLNSGGQTIVNKESIPPGSEWPLHAGDRLQVGPLEFLVQLKEKPLSERDAEEWALKSLDVDQADQDEEDKNPDREVLIDAAAAAASILGVLRDQKGVVKGRLRIAQEEGVTSVRFNDVYLVDEAELALVKRELLNHLTQPRIRVLLDFKNVKRMSSAAADMIADVHAYLRTYGSKLALCRLQADLKPALESRNLLTILPYFADKKWALTESW